MLRDGSELPRAHLFLDTELEFATPRGCQPPGHPSGAGTPGLTVASGSEEEGGGAPAPGIVTESGALLAPRDFPPGFVACRDSEPARVDLKVGQWVRVRRYVVKPLYGWGRGCHGEIGRIVSTDKDGDPIVAFPSCPRFTSEWAELQLVVYLEPGDAVVWRPSLQAPAFGWGGSKRSEVGVVRGVNPTCNEAIVRFGRMPSVRCKISELTWTTAPSPAAQRDALKVGTHVRIREHVLVTRAGDGDVRRGEVGVVLALDGDGDVLVAWPSHKRWRGHCSDLEDAGTWCVGDLASLRTEAACRGRTYPVGHVGMLLNINHEGHATVELEKDYVVLRLDQMADATTPAADAGLYAVRPILPGAHVRLANPLLATAAGLNMDQVGVVTSSRFADTHWSVAVSFPGNHAWTGKAQELIRNPAVFLKGDWVSLSPTMKKPLLGWGPMEGNVRYGDVGIVLDRKEVEDPRRKLTVYVTRWPGGHVLALLSFEMIPAGKAPAAAAAPARAPTPSPAPTPKPKRSGCVVM